MCGSGRSGTMRPTSDSTPREGGHGYRVHRFDMKMTGDRATLERFLNGLDGEVVAIVPNVTMKAFWVHVVGVLLIVEKVGRSELEDGR